MNIDFVTSLDMWISFSIPHFCMQSDSCSYIWVAESDIVFSAMTDERIKYTKSDLLCLRASEPRSQQLGILDLSDICCGLSSLETINLGLPWKCHRERGLGAISTVSKWYVNICSDFIVGIKISYVIYVALLKIIIVIALCLTSRWNQWYFSSEQAMMHYCITLRDHWMCINIWVLCDTTKHWKSQEKSIKRFHWTIYLCIWWLITTFTRVDLQKLWYKTYFRHQIIVANIIQRVI